MKGLVTYGQAADGTRIAADFTFNKEGDTTTFWSNLLNQQVTITAGKILDYPTRTRTGAAFFKVELKHRQWTEIYSITKLR